MVFVTVGSQKFQFNRLLESIDNLMDQKVLLGNVFAQIGYSDYKPRNYEYARFLHNHEFQAYLKKCMILVTHGGTGTIIKGIKEKKKVIAIPRLKEYGEHVDDHQVQILEEFHGMGIIHYCYNPEELKHYINSERERKLLTYKSNTGSIIASIEDFICGKDVYFY